MNYAAIKKFDIANGPGVRVSLFVSGCRHKCKNCFNSEAWDFEYGNRFTEDTLTELLDALSLDYIEGFSLLGGEPFEPENQECVLKILKTIKEKLPQKTVWCYTGFLYDNQLLKGKVGNLDTVKGILSNIDVLVDGKFVEELKSLDLLFRGSSNQRIIDVKKSLEENSVVWLDGIWQRRMGSGDIYEQEKIMKVNFKKLNENAVMPTYGSEYAAGADLYACTGGETVTFLSGETRLIKTGLAMEIPEGYAGLIYARSGIANKRGLAPSNKVGVIDSDYRGEIMVSLHNHSNETQSIADGERIAQLVITPFLKVEYTETDELSDTVRGEGGFGSTGKK